MISGNFWKGDVCGNWLLWIPFFFQIFLITPVIAFMGYKHKAIGVAVCSGLGVASIIYGFYICYKYTVSFPNYQNAMSYFSHYDSDPIARSLGYWIGCAGGFLTFHKIENLDDQVQFSALEDLDPNFVNYLKANRWNISKMVISLGVVVGIFSLYMFYFKIGLDNGDPEWAQAMFCVFGGVGFTGGLFYCIWKILEVVPQIKFSLGSWGLFNLIAKLSYPIGIFHILFAITKTWDSNLIPKYSWYAFAGKMGVEYVTAIVVAFGLTMLIDMPLRNLFQVYCEDLWAKPHINREQKLMTMKYPRNYENYKDAKISNATTKASLGKLSKFSGLPKFSNFTNKTGAGKFD